MRLNESTALIGKRVVLVPYRKEHVERYHQWMEDEDLREATASERLTMEEEFDMQRKWQQDPDKLTFIILSLDDDTPLPQSPTQLHQFIQSHNSPQNMIGDVNLFLNPPSTPPSHHCEIEMMIASPSNRKRGYGSESLRLFLTYCLENLHLKTSEFCVKIGQENMASRRMFEKLGFKLGKEVNVWKEVEYWWGGGERWGWEDDIEYLLIKDITF